MITANELREIVDYEPLTGLFRWRDTFAAGLCCAHIRPRPKAGAIVKGHRAAIGYFYIRLKGRPYLMHRLAWLHVHGCWPREGLHIDHVDHDGFNNRLNNLREATRSQNYFNQRTSGRNTSGYRGVSWHPQAKRWRAAVWTNGKRVESLFADINDAAEWRDAMAKKLHGEFVVLNFPET